MPKCDHLNAKGDCCPYCGADLDLTKNEIKNRDSFFESFKKILDKNEKTKGFSRKMTDTLFKYHGATIADLIFKMAVKNTAGMVKEKYGIKESKVNDDATTVL